MRQTTERHSPDRVRTIEEKVIDAMHRYAYSLVREYARPTDRLLEVGFGEGYGSEIVRTWVREYVGVEVEDDAVAHAVERYPQQGSTFLAYDGETLPFDDSSFDLVISFQVLEHVREPDRFLREARRVARDGGVVLVVTRTGITGSRTASARGIATTSASSARVSSRQSMRRSFARGRDIRNPWLASHERDRAQSCRSRSRLARLDPLGLRYRLPESIDMKLRAALRRRSGSDGRRRHADDVDVSHMHHGTDTASSLDLLAVGRG